MNSARMLALYMCFNGTGIWGGETMMPITVGDDAIDGDVAGDDHDGG